MEAKSLKILAIDDNRDNLMVLKAIVADTFPGAALVTASSGPLGLARARAEDPDVILLDIVMPEMDGFEVCRRLKEDEHLRRIPVVFLTALKTDRASHTKALEAGGEAFLTKPIDEAELTAQIRAMVKIKTLNERQQQEQERLSRLVAERTRDLVHELTERRHMQELLVRTNQDLQQSQTSALSLLEDLKAEIDAHKQSETALRESEERYRVLFDGMTDAVFVNDLREDGLPGRFVAVNGAACQRLGYTREELLGLTPADIDAPESTVDRQEIVDRLKRDEQVLFEQIHLAKDGQRFSVEVNAQTFRMQERLLVLSVVRDITDRKRIEQAHAFLAKCGSAATGENFFQSVARYLAGALDAHFVCIDRLQEGNLVARTLAVFCNGKFEENVTYALKDTPCGDVVGKTVCCFARGVRELFPNDAVLREIDAESYVGSTLWSSQGQPIGLIALIWRHPLANPELAKSIIGLVAGRAAGELERLKAEQALSASEAELEAIYDSTPLMMCLVNRRSELERVNRTMSEFVGHPVSPGSRQHPGDFLGCVKALLDPRGCGLGPECHACPLRLAVVKTFETGEPCRQLETTMALVLRGERRELQVSASTTLVRMQAEPKVLVCLEDITARKQLETQVLHAQKMEAVGQLAGGVAHDFNNILAATLLQLQILRQTENIGPEMTASLLELEAGTQRAANLTRQLLLFSRRQVMQTRRVDFNEVVKALTKMLQRLLGEHIDMVVNPEAEPVWVEADPGMLEQVVMNLCINARDAMTQGGRLELGLRRTTLEPAEVCRRPEARPGAFVCLSATDTGCGMNETTLKRVFEPFFTTKEPGKGTGLGLATVHGIVRQHRGWVEVESAVDRGTTFRVFLPAAEAPATAPVANGKARSRGGTETILLVEDDEQVRRLVRMTLGLYGYAILEAGDSAEALRIWELQGNRVNLLFTDMVMPGGVTGLELAERLRQTKPDLKVLISSGYAADLLEQKGLAEGITFLAKPYDPNLLAGVVRECLDLSA